VLPETKGLQLKQQLSLLQKSLAGKIVPGGPCPAGVATVDCGTSGS